MGGPPLELSRGEAWDRWLHDDGAWEVARGFAWSRWLRAMVAAEDPRLTCSHPYLYDDDSTTVWCQDCRALAVEAEASGEMDAYLMPDNAILILSDADTISVRDADTIGVYDDLFRPLAHGMPRH